MPSTKKKTKEQGSFYLTFKKQAMPSPASVAQVKHWRGWEQMLQCVNLPVEGFGDVMCAAGPAVVLLGTHTAGVQNICAPKNVHACPVSTAPNWNPPIAHPCSGRMNRCTLVVYSGTLHSSEDGPVNVTGGCHKVCRSHITGGALHDSTHGMFQTGQSAPDVRSQRAAALGEVGCLMGRVPRGFREAGFLLLLSVGRDYTGVLHGQ